MTERVDTRLIAFAEELADEAARVIRPHFRSALAVEEKHDESPVTIADKEAEEAMRALIARRFPGHGIVGEEHGETRADAEYRWVLDPIDGTKSFILGLPTFATLIALEHQGRPILGVIDQPIVRHRVVGTEAGTTLNGNRVRVRECASLAAAYLLTPDHLMVEKHQDASSFEALTRAVKCYRCTGDGYAYGLLACGFADVIVDPIMNLWDLSALIPVVRGAGGRITDWQGNDPVGATSSVAAHPAIHARVIELLAG